MMGMNLLLAMKNFPMMGKKRHLPLKKLPIVGRECCLAIIILPIMGNSKKRLNHYGQIFSSSSFCLTIMVRNEVKKNKTWTIMVKLKNAYGISEPSWLSWTRVAPFFWPYWLSTCPTRLEHRASTLSLNKRHNDPRNSSNKYERREPYEDEFKAVHERSCDSGLGIIVVPIEVGAVNSQKSNEDNGDQYA